MRGRRGKAEALVWMGLLALAVEIRGCWRLVQTPRCCDDCGNDQAHAVGLLVHRVMSGCWAQ